MTTEFKNEFTWGNALAANSTQEFHENFETALVDAKKEIGYKFPIIINGKEIYSEENFSVHSPSDRRIKIADFPKSTVSNTEDAISSAKKAFEEWSNFSFQKRVEIFREVCRLLCIKKILLGCDNDF